ncbi:MAG TPA: aminotransferase class IV [Candidatus Synoicihabitans sp.]|nr:aminotransferase class IV [Candidatus Synoicihabitans sp.]
MSTAYIQANTNGRLHSADEPSLSPLNRGFLYGDAIYEVWRTYHGVIFAWQEHWLRLERSASALHLRLPWTPTEIFEQIRRTVTAFRATIADAGELYVRLQIARGEGSIGLDPALADEPVFVLLVQRVPQLAGAALDNGLRLTIATTLRRNHISTLDPAWKTGNYLNNILCLREARSRGADEVLIPNLAGEITEAAVCNVVFLEAQRLVSPPKSSGILAGITRHLIAREVAARAGLEWSEAAVRPGDLGRFQECALLSTTKDVQPVSSIDHHPFNVTANSSMRRLKMAFAEYASDYARAHPELAV